MMFRRIFLAVSLILPLAAFAEKPVIDVVTSEYPPYGYAQNGEVAGTDTQIIRKVLSKMGYQANIRILPWARAENLVRAGKADMLYSLTFSESRHRYYHFTDPISSAQDVFFKLEDRPLQWQSLEDLQGLNIGISAAYSYAPEFMNWLFNGNAQITKITHEKPELTGLRLVALGRIDLFICEQSVCEYLIEKNISQYPKLARVGQMKHAMGPERGFRAAFSRKLPEGEELRDRFNQALDELRNAGKP